MRLRAPHWLVAFAGAVALHAGVAAAVLRQPPESGARAAGTGGIEVSLGPSGGAPATAAPVAPETADTAAPTAATAAEPPPPPDARTAESAPAETVPVETVATVAPVETTPVEVAEAVPTEPEPADMVPLESAEVVPVPPVAAEPPPPPEPAPVRMAAAPPLPKSKPVAPPVRRQPEPEQAAAEPAPAAPTPAPPVETQFAAGPQAPPPPAGAGGRAGTQASREAGSAEATAAGGLPGASTDYLSLLQAWLARHKEYPRRSRMRRQEGTALLRFVMDRDGRVLDFSIQRSSGHPDLDHEVEQMIRRAQPLPPIPADLRQARLELVVPVQFVLR